MTTSPALDAFADQLHELLHERALSVGLIDIAVEVNDGHVDGELLFGEGPDMGFTLDARAGACRFCELVPPDAERWLDEELEGIAVLDLDPGAAGDEDRRGVALQLLRALLDARRPLLQR